MILDRLFDTHLVGDIDIVATELHDGGWIVPGGLGGHSEGLADLAVAAEDEDLIG
jgi:hypothetical protein